MVEVSASMADRAAEEAEDSPDSAKASLSPEGSRRRYGPSRTQIQLVSQPGKAELKKVVLIIGMRGAGKTGLGFKAAKDLRCAFNDLDEAITNSQGGKLPPEIVTELGWAAFREIELNQLKKALDPATGAAVVSCGGGIIETDAGLALVEAHWPVIMIDRHVDDILEYLKHGKDQAHRASLGEHPRQTYARRLPKYLQVADFRFPVDKGEDDIESLGRIFVRFLRHIVFGGPQRKAPGSPLCLGSDTYLISPGVPHYHGLSAEVIRKLSHKADALELRLDLLESLDHGFVALQVAAMRRYTAGVPLLFTLRSVDQGGFFAGSEEEYFALLRLGVQLACELIDVESHRDKDKIAALAALPGRGMLVGSAHELAQKPNSDSNVDMQGLFRRCMLGGQASLARVMVKGKTRDDCWRLEEAAVAVLPPGMPFIAMALGVSGHLSCLLNRVLCPVAPEDPQITSYRPPPLASGVELQLPSLGVISSCRRKLGLICPKWQFPILGAAEPRDAGLVSLLHSAACEDLGIATNGCGWISACTRHEVMQVLARTSVGGVVVASDLRELVSTQILKDVDADADTIVSDAGKLRGVSTDCLAISTRLRGRGVQQLGADSVCLVSGIGHEARAAVRALRDLGVGCVLRTGLQGASEQAAAAKASVFAVTIRKKPGDDIGLEVSGRPPALLVGTPLSRHFADWNTTHPAKAVHAGDRIVSVEGNTDALTMAQACMDAADLTIFVERHLHELLASTITSQETLDAWVIAGQCSAPATPELEAALKRLRPLVVEAVFEPVPPAGILQCAENMGCTVVPAPELWHQQACVRMESWNDMQAPRRSIARALMKLVAELPGRKPTAWMEEEASSAPL